MKRTITSFLLITCMMVVTISCEQGPTEGGNLNTVFSYRVSGFVVTFQNFTDMDNVNPPYATYVWNFGDGAVDTTVSPTHIYSKKGKYTVTLTAIKSGQKSKFSSTITVAGPDIVIDGDFSDWKHVPYTYMNDNNSGSTLSAIKAFSNGRKINFYIEGTSKMTFSPAQMYFNTDNNTGTGYKVGMYPAGSGTDYLYEGNLFGWGSIKEHTGGPSDWSWNVASTFGVGTKFSDIIEVSNGKNAIEFSIAKSALGNVENSLSFAIYDLNAAWSPKGSIPIAGQDTSKFINIKF